MGAAAPDALRRVSAIKVKGWDLPIERRPVLNRISVEPSSDFFPGVEILKRVGVMLDGRPKSPVIEANALEGWIRVPLDRASKTVKVSPNGVTPSRKLYGHVQIVWVS